MTCLYCLPLLLGLVAQAPPPAGDTPADLKARLEFMKTSMAALDVHATDARGTRPPTPPIARRGDEGPCRRSQ